MSHGGTCVGCSYLFNFTLHLVNNVGFAYEYPDSMGNVSPDVSTFAVYDDYLFNRCDFFFLFQRLYKIVQINCQPVVQVGSTAISPYFMFSNT